MPKIRTLSDVYIAPKSILRKHTSYLKLHILSNQLERLKNNKNSILERLEQTERRIQSLKYHYEQMREAVYLQEQENR